MNSIARPIPVLLVQAACVVACGRSEGLAPFTNDGCSVFPDRGSIASIDWCACCFEHDVAYWKGGTVDERESADRHLAECVRAATGDETLARMMYEGVRAGGSPYFYNGYRWGYGWSDGRVYKALTDDEQILAARLLDTSSVSLAWICPI